MRNILVHVDYKDKAVVAEELKQIRYQPDKEAALKLARMFLEEFLELFPQAVQPLQEGLEDSLQFYELPRFNARRISSTTMQERLYREIRRRSRVVGIFPARQRALHDRLIRVILSADPFTADTERAVSYTHLRAHET